MGGWGALGVWGEGEQRGVWGEKRVCGESYTIVSLKYVRILSPHTPHQFRI